MQELEQHFRDAGAQYASLKRACEERVVRWEWATFSIYSPQPFYFERERIGRGRKLEGRPTTIKSGTHQYGFDGDGRIVVVRIHKQPDGEGYDEEFFAHAADFVDGWQFCRRRPKNSPDVVEPINVSRQRFSGGRLISLTTAAVGGSSAEAYEYGDRGRIVRVRGRYQNREDAERAFSYSDDLDYDEIGRLHRVRRVHPVQPRYPEGSERVIYQRPLKGQSARELAAVIEEKLLRLVPETLRAAGFGERVYCLLLAYNSNSPDLPPRLGVGLERQRRAWVAEHGTGAKHYVWNRPEFEWSGEEAALSLGSDAELAAVCELFNQQLAIKDNCAPARKLLNAVAARLGHADWTGVLEVTDDFVVVAYDDEEIDLARNFKASVGAARLSMLKARGWL